MTWIPYDRDDAQRRLLREATRRNRDTMENLVALLEMGRIEAGMVDGEIRYRTAAKYAAMAQDEFKKTQDDVTEEKILAALRTATERIRS